MVKPIVMDPKRIADLFGLKPSRSAIGKANKSNGNNAELIAIKALKQHGFKLVEKIETGFTVVRRGNKITSAFPKGKVSGDIRAIARGGVAVHCEVKYRPNKTLKCSDFEEHQLAHLKAVSDAHGIAIVIWVTSIYPEKLYLLEWPFPMAKGRGITEEKAAEHVGEYFGFVNGNPV